MSTYRVNEIFYSIQGEGMRVGTPNVFVRLSGCNMDCHEGHAEPNADFDCDTEFVSGVNMSANEIFDRAQDLVDDVPPGVIFTGGEPGLQLDQELINTFRVHGCLTSIETNGTVDLSGLGLDWITCSPKVAEHALKLTKADEVKYVRHHGQGIPKPKIKAKHKLISPAFKGQQLDREAVEWCVHLVKENPSWRLSIQSHKWIMVR